MQPFSLFFLFIPWIKGRVFLSVSISEILPVTTVLTKMKLTKTKHASLNTPLHKLKQNILTQRSCTTLKRHLPFGLTEKLKEAGTCMDFQDK